MLLLIVLAIPVAKLVRRSRRALLTAVCRIVGGRHARPAADRDDVVDVYFGWARSDTPARSMGLDVTMFGFTTQDYVMRGLSTSYIPLLVTVRIALGWLAPHHRVLVW